MHTRNTDAHFLRDLLGARVASELLQQPARDADELVDRLDHMNGDADGTRLVGDGARDRLPYPPRRIRAELVALAVIEFFDRLQKPEVALLDEVEKEHPASDVAFGDAHDEAQVRLLQAVTRRHVPRLHTLCELDLLLCRQQRHMTDLLEVHPHGVVE